ncbi:MAG: hypothetical protein N2111_01255 [Candidatus Sumerlaeaceae bacterium]|nr:hypothetical protein [Candidatus Sumerlaeaceae bacterium]
MKRNPALQTNTVQTIVGVDFSGASDAGRHIWICSARPRDHDLIIEQVQPAETLCGGSYARDAALAALREYLSGRSGVLAGLDFPFSLPAAIIGESSYRAFVSGFAAKYGSAEAFYAACRRAGRGRELKRATDIEAGAPFAPANLRMFRQTFYGIRDILAPLIASGGVCVVPMMAARRDRAILIEICPAVFLRRLGLYSPYKGPASRARSARSSLLDALRARFRLGGLTQPIRRLIVGQTQGDALDSVLAAVATFSAWREGRLGMAPRGDLRQIEGEIF